MVNASRIDADRDWLAGPGRDGAELRDRSAAWRCSRSRARPPWTWWACRSSPRSRSPRAEVCGVRRHRRSHRIHGRAGGRDDGGCRAGRRAVGWAPGRRRRAGRARRPGHAPARRCAIRCTATTCRRAARRSRRGWAGCARSTQGLRRRRGAARQRERGRLRPAGRLPDGGARHPPPGDGDRARRRGDQRDDVAVARASASAWATSPPTSPPRAPRSRSTCAAGPVAARVAKKPLYVKERLK